MVTYLVEFLVAMLATIAFAVLFSVPKKELAFCGISGAIGWIVYYAFTEADLSPVFACLIGTLILTIFARAMAVIRKNPATVYLLTGIFPLVPGAGVYYSAYNLITGNNALASAKGLQTLEIAFAITFGIIFGFSIPQALFHKLGAQIEKYHKKK